MTGVKRAIRCRHHSPNAETQHQRGDRNSSAKSTNARLPFSRSFRRSQCRLTGEGTPIRPKPFDSCLADVAGKLQGPRRSFFAGSGPFWLQGLLGCWILFSGLNLFPGLHYAMAHTMEAGWGPNVQGKRASPNKMG